MTLIPRRHADLTKRPHERAAGLVRRRPRRGREPDQRRVDAIGPATLAWSVRDRRVSDDERRIVCIVDDDASLRRSLRNLLTSVGLRVETFQSADAFLTSVHRQNTGCMVLDLRMEGMNGLDLMKHLAATGSSIPVIVLTAHGDEDTRQRTLEAGAVAFLKKPFQSAALVDAVRSALSTA